MLIIVNIVVTYNYLSLWFLLVIIADILLIIGAMNSIMGLLMVWMIIGMINIVFLFIAWLALPIYGAIAIFATSLCSKRTWSSALEAAGYEGEKVEADCGGVDTWILGSFIFNMIFIIGLPIYYVYLWIVVKSHRENLRQMETAIQPIHLQPGQ